MSPKHKVALIAIIAFILFLSLGLNAPPVMVNSLSGQIDSLVKIHINPVRILFEPFIGFLLFLVRGIYPLQEYLVLLLWIVLIDLIVLISTRNLSILRVLGQWGSRFALHLAVWSGVLLIMLFGHLPANSVINLSGDQALVNIHSHTDYSHDGLVSHQELHAWHARKGFDAYFLTEHNHHAHTLDWVQKQSVQEIPSQPVVLAGQEYSGSNHILLLGLNRNFITKDMPDAVAIDSAHAQNGVALVAHWFSHKKHPLIKYIRDGADGFEIANQAEGLYVIKSDRQSILDHARAHGLLLLVSCDYHGYGPAAYAYNAFEIPGWKGMSNHEKRNAIMDILRNREQDRIRPLVYKDRPVYPDAWLWISPLINLIAYFRHLSVWQTLSWIFWLPLIGWLLSRWRGKAVLSLAAIIASGVLLYFGIKFLILSGQAFAENEIYAEYGTYITILAPVLFIASIIYHRVNKASWHKLRNG